MVESTHQETAGEDGQWNLILRVRPKAGQRQRRSRCQRRCAGHDRRGEARRWRRLDWGTTIVYLEADAYRVSERAELLRLRKQVAELGKDNASSAEV